MIHFDEIPTRLIELSLKALRNPFQRHLVSKNLLQPITRIIQTFWKFLLKGQGQI